MRPIYRVLKQARAELRLSKRKIQYAISMARGVSRVRPMEGRGGARRQGAPSNVRMTGTAFVGWDEMTGCEQTKIKIRETKCLAQKGLPPTAGVESTALHCLFVAWRESCRPGLDKTSISVGLPQQFCHVSKNTSVCMMVVKGRDKHSAWSVPARRCRLISRGWCTARAGCTRSRGPRRTSRTAPPGGAVACGES